MNSQLGASLGALVAISGVSLGVAATHGHAAPAQPVHASTPTVSVTRGDAPPAITDVDFQGHVYTVTGAATPISPDNEGIVCEYLGPHLIAHRAGSDGVEESCPASPPTVDVIWPSSGGAALPPDLGDPDTRSCLAAGGQPSPPQLGGGGGPGAPVDFCMIGGHLWGPGGQTGAPWSAMVFTSLECRLLGGSYSDATDPDIHPSGYNCVKS